MNTSHDLVSGTQSPPHSNMSPKNNNDLGIKWTTKVQNISRKEKAAMIDNKIEEFENSFMRLDTDCLGINEMIT